MVKETKTSETFSQHPCTPIQPFVKLAFLFHHRMMPSKFCDNISNSSGVIVLTDRHQYTQADTTQN